MKTCSNCIHAASKNRYANTVPSIHTCMNEQAKYYLEDMSWSNTCNLWHIMPDIMFLNGL